MRCTTLGDHGERAAGEGRWLGEQGNPAGAAGATATVLRALVVVAAVVVTVAPTAAFVLDPGLAHVSPSAAWENPMIRSGRPLDATLLLVLTSPVLGATILGWAPRSGSFSSRRRVAMAMTGGAVLLVTAAGSWVLAEAFFFFPDAECRYPTCWPLQWQRWASCAPAILLGSSMIVVSVVRSGRRTAIVPALVWIIAVALQRFAWDDVLVPVFAGPPP